MYILFTRCNDRTAELYPDFLHDTVGSSMCITLQYSNYLVLGLPDEKRNTCKNF